MLVGERRGGKYFVPGYRMNVCYPFLVFVSRFICYLVCEKRLVSKNIGFNGCLDSFKTWSEKGEPPLEL